MKHKPITLKEALIQDLECIITHVNLHTYEPQELIEMRNKVYSLLVSSRIFSHHVSLSLTKAFHPITSNFSFLCSRNVLNTIIETFLFSIFLFLDYEKLRTITKDATVESGKASKYILI